MADRKKGNAQYNAQSNTSLLHATISGATSEFFGSMIMTFISMIAYQTLYIEKGAVLSAAMAVGFGHYLTVTTFMGGTSGFFSPFLLAPVLFSWVQLDVCSYQKALVSFFTYTFVQVVGSLVGGLGFLAIAGTDSTLGVPVVQYGVNDWRAWFMEVIIVTFFTALCMVIYLAKKRGKSSLHDVALGRAFGAVALYLISVRISGGILEPLHWFVPALYTSTWDSGWIWTTAPFLGMFLGAILFAILSLLLDTSENALWSKPDENRNTQLPTTLMRMGK